MKTHAQVARELRDFISAVINAPPGEMNDLLHNVAESLIHQAELDLGTEAFAIGDRIIVDLNEGHGEFGGVVSGTRRGLTGEPLFVVKDGDDDAFEFSIGEIRPNTDA